MCGIFGGIKNVKHENLKILGICNETRGTDSTGLFDSEGWVKDILSFRYFILADTSNKLTTFQNYLVGHTRFKTTGAITDRNAHPFEFGKITGVHNGIISNFVALKKTYNVPHLECDSEIIFYLLDKKGVEGLKELEGYYAIVWKDETQPDKLFFLNHDSVLSYIREKSSLYFCSDSQDLSITFGFTANIIEFEKDNLYEINIDTLKIKKEKVKGLQQYTPIKYTPITNHLYQNYSKNEEWIESNWNTTVTSKNKTNKKYWKNKKKQYKKKIDNYTVNCPYCNEVLYLHEVQKGQCCYCRTYLTGEVFSCYHCEGLVLSEQIKDDDKCPLCDMHMVISEKYLVAEPY